MKTHGNHFGKLAGVALVLCLLMALIPVTVAAPTDGYIEVGTMPVPDFVGTPLRGKAPLNVAFTDQSAGARQNMTYNWSFGDGTYSNTSGNVTHTYTKEGNYTVTLTLSNDYGVKNMTKTNYIYVGSGPVANFTANQTASNSALNVKFTDQSTGNPTTYLWNFGDGTTSNEKSPTHNYDKVGSYTVSLTVSNEFGNDTMTKTGYINIGVAPYVFFTANSTCDNTKQIVFTTYGSVTDPATYNWNFGDGTTSTEKNPTHNYKSAGVYNVTLNVTDKYATTTYTLKNVVVSDTVKADFTATNNQGAAPLKVQFTDQSTGSGNLSYLWNFGDGTTSTDKNPSHTYNQTGTYTVALTVVSSCGVNSVVKQNFVSVGKTPVADFSGTPTDGAATLSVQYTDKSQGENLTYSWDFGDGITSTEKNPKHNYTTGGVYTVKLTVKNQYGTNTMTKDKYITVGSAPRADFQADVLSGVAPHPVQFTDLSTGNPTSWSWDFGDGGTSTEKNPKHTYQKSGYYNVTLTVKNQYGESTLFRMGDGQKIYLEDQKVNETNTTNQTNQTNQTNDTNNTTKPESSIPGFEVVFAIAAILGLVGVGLYKRRK
ncbi:hypothetical protein MsAg5_14690 [Methanosarcinaceae archaeon Ag5]|uniref:PKD domain-containing protein n=1 Tax=Methanolapillus africanus TaxID=3028297 RepID=A0AAE4SFQ2_9EURY|nr:hypothetical protein [Methanosarcinaceae archaeon Ag5]